MKNPAFASPASTTFLLGLLTCVAAHAAPVKSVTVTGAKPGPAVRILVGRTEREKACGIDQQLAGFALKKGSLVIETHLAGEPITPADGKTPALELVLVWPKEVKDGPDDDRKPPIQRPAVAASNPAKILPLLTAAIGDSLSEKAVELIKISPLQASGQRVEIHFPAPQSGVSKARQFRISRRFAASLLADMGLIEPLTVVWPTNFPSKPVICNYDAEGVGYFGSTLLERAVDETTLDMRVVSVCPEDIRDGALDKAAGVMFPGGSGKAIAKALHPEGVAKVRDYVGSGHGYYGVCAGAYLAASGLDEYTGMIPLKHTQPWAKGKGMVKLDLTPEGIALAGAEFSRIDTRYNCGPVFADVPAPTPDSPITVLARFASPATDIKGVTHDEMVGTPAVISTTWKKGRVMIVSPHPESHQEFNAMVARFIGWSLGKEPKSIVARGK
ncbi:hypothetical protein HQ447_08690 [bacterium]|nr:hypothetical protein [bacterium]